MLHQCKVVFSNLKNKTQPQLKKPFIQTWIFFLKRARSVFLLNQKIRGRVIFIHIPKCGGTSIEAALGIPFKFHDTAQLRRRRVGASAWKRAFSFALIRHPYSRIVSLYNYHRRRHTKFADQLRLNEWIVEVFEKKTPAIIGDLDPKSCYSYISDNSKNIIVDKWIKIEEIDKRWSDLEADLLGIKGIRLKRPIELPKKNVSPSGSASVRDLTERSKQIIYNALSEDFNHFNYEK